MPDHPRDFPRPCDAGRVWSHVRAGAVIELHLRSSQIDPSTNVHIRSTQLVTNWSVRNAVDAWLVGNPGVTPEGWTSRALLSPKVEWDDRNRCFLHAPDVFVLSRWRESCPELRDLWREDDPGRWVGVTWLDGRVTKLDLSGKRLSGTLPRLEVLASLQKVQLDNNQLTGSIPEKLFEGPTSLEQVSLQNNQLTGSIPENLFEGLTSLKKVFLYDNQLSDIFIFHFNNI